MFARFIKPTGFKAAAGVQMRIAQQARYMATVEGSTGRVMPGKKARSTPISHDRATFTIRVCRCCLHCRKENADGV